jgi:hypothetical protein
VTPLSIAMSLGNVGMVAFLLTKLGDTSSDQPILTCLTNNDSNIRSAAAYVLGSLVVTNALNSLIMCLSDQDLYVRRATAESLGQLGNKQAVPNLVEALPDWDNNEKIGLALERLGWNPTSDSDWVYMWICKADGPALKTHWQETRKVLLADVKSGNRRKIENAVYTFVSLGQEEIIPELVHIIKKNGNREMAETYLNCGQEDLGQAARTWAKKHGYEILSGQAANEASWGQW